MELIRLGFDVNVAALTHQNNYLAMASRRLTSAPWLPLAEMKLDNTAAALHSCLIPYFADFRNADCVHETYFSLPRVLPRQPLVVTVYDMIHEMYPDLMGAGNPTSCEKAAAVHRADRVICISQQTADDLIDRIPTVARKVVVVHLGGGTEPAVSPSQDTPSFPRPYLLYVGQRGAYKNFARLVKAFAASRTLQRLFQLRLFGGGPLSREELGLLSDTGISQSSVVHCGSDERKLASLYRGAAALVYPSMYEGFGMPLVEAMSHDCPIVSSTGGSLPEVAGPAAEYFDPSSHEDLARAIEAVALHPTRRTELIDLGRVRRSLFTWSRCASETAAVYRSIA